MAKLDKALQDHLNPTTSSELAEDPDAPIDVDGAPIDVDGDGWKTPPRVRSWMSLSSAAEPQLPGTSCYGSCVLCMRMYVVWV